MTILKVNSTQLTKGLNTGLRRVQKFASRASKSIAGFVKRAAKSFSLLGVGAAAGFGAISVAAAKSGRELKAWSDTLGVAPKVLQEWQFAAKSVGFESEKLTDIFKDVNDKLGDFVLTGGGEAATVLKKLGFTANQFKGLKADEALQKIADASAFLGKQERVFIFEAIANDASKLIPLLDNGGEKLRKITTDFKQLGVALSVKQVNELEKLNKAFLELSSVITGLVNQFTANVSERIVGVIETFKEWIKSYGGVGAIAKRVFNTIISAFGKIKKFAIDSINTTINGFIMFIGKVDDLQTTLINTGKTFKAFALEGKAALQDLLGIVTGVLARLASLGGFVNTSLGQRLDDISAKAQARAGLSRAAASKLKGEVKASQEQDKDANQRTPFDISKSLPNLVPKSQERKKLLIGLSPELIAKIEAGGTSFGDTDILIEQAVRAESK